MIINGNNRAGSAAMVTRQISLRFTLSLWIGYLLFLEMMYAITMRANASIIPGKYPARKSAATETSIRDAYMIIMMLGGIMGPSTDDALVTAALKSASYPSSVMAGIMIEPMDAASEAAEPEIPM